MIWVNMDKLIQNVLNAIFIIHSKLLLLPSAICKLIMQFNMVKNKEENKKKYFEIPSDWMYRGEGNCNVVLSLPSTCKILRIRKTDRSNSFIMWLSNIINWSCGVGFFHESRDLEFYMKIMRPLFGSNYVSEAQQVLLSRREIKTLERDLSNYRPDHRKCKVLQNGRATLFEDFAYLPNEYVPFNLSKDTFAVEIKPKQGWMSYSEKSFPKCLFCMNQYQKLKENKVNKISNYCPEDLFSGDKFRMKDALKSLIETPQNNFKLFKNGKLLYGENETKHFDKILEEIFNSSETFECLQDEFCEFLQKCLTTDLLVTEKVNNCKQKLFCEWNNIIQDSYRNYKLPKGCVLEKILSVQMLDTEGSVYFNKILADRPIRDWYYVKKLLKEIGESQNDTCLKCFLMMLSNVENLDKSDENDLIFAAYLISAVAKDCSLMLTFRKINEEVNDDLGMKNVIETKCGSFILNIGIFDLYPKSLSTIKKHVKRNKKVLETYNKFK